MLCSKMSPRRTRTEETPERKRLAAQTVNKVLTTAAAVLKRAIRHNWCIRNPAASVERARIAPNQVIEGEPQSRDANRPVREDEVLNLDDIRCLLDAAEPGYYRTVFMTAALTGMRSGELLGLRWSDVDVYENRIHVRRSLSWRSGAEIQRASRRELSQPRFFEPKTATSRSAIIPLSAELASALKRVESRCPKGKDELVFPSPTSATGAPAHRSNVLKPRALPCPYPGEALLCRYAFAASFLCLDPDCRRHPDCRGSGAPGPFQPAQTTLKVYSHWFQTLKTSSIDTLAKALLKTQWTHGGTISSDEPGHIAVNDGENP